MIGLRGRIRPPKACAAAALAAIVSPLAGHSTALADETPEGIVEKAQWLEQRGQLEQAKELLSRAAAQNPNDELVALARADAYVREKNPFWALKILGELIEKHPPACAARALAARVHIREANLEQAAQMLEAVDCEKREESRLRFALLRLELAELNGERPGVNQELQLSQATSRRYEEDDRRLGRLVRRYDPWHEPSFAFKLDLGVGWASHGMGSVPLDLPVSREHSGSPLLGMDLSAGWIPVRFPAWHPVIEAEAHLAQYLESPTKALSTRQAVLRLGAEFGRGPRRLFIAYSGDFISLDGGSAYPNDSFAYAVGDRLEYRLKLEPSWLVYGAFGRRKFWQRDRSRLESEQGLSKSIPLSNSIDFVVGGAWRVYKAEHHAYDQFGATLNSVLAISLPKGFELRESVSLAHDIFPRSEGYFVAGSRERRKDLLLRVGVGLTTPEILSLRLGGSYSYVSRNSSVDAYDFADHRGLFSITWQTDSDRLGVSRIPQSGRVPLPYPDDDASADGNKQNEITEVMRKDETQRQNTSCMK